MGVLTPFVQKMIKRLQDLAQDSSAVKPHVIPQMEALNNFMAELVNFGISVRYRRYRRSRLSRSVS